MLRRSILPLAAVAVAVLASACTDESPTLLGDDFFPSGRPTTVQVVLPGDAFFRAYGDFAGYPRSAQSPALLVAAEDFGGALDARVLLRFVPPAETPEYTQGGTQRRDSIRALTAGRVVAGIDSLATAAGTQATVQLWELAQGFDPFTVSWELAVDSAGERTPWREAGGTRGALLSQATYTPAAPGDSISFALDSATVNRVTAIGAPGLVVTVSTGSRVQFRPFVLRTGAHPARANPDTVIPLTITTGPQTFVFSPDQPRSATALEVGGIRSARTLFRLDVNAQVPACPPGGPACGTVALSDVRLNEVALLFRPVATPGGFTPLDSLPLNIARVSEPELGFRAPLGQFFTIDLATPLAVYAPGDSVVTLPITFFALSQIARDSAVAGDFALVSAPEASTFGALFLEPTPRLRITYTLPVAPRFP